MAQSQIQEFKQEQTLKQMQNFTQQQLLQAQLVELPLSQLLDRINMEMHDNPALETVQPGETPDDYAADSLHDGSDDMGMDDGEGITENMDGGELEERRSALDEVLSTMALDDEDLPVYPRGSNGTAEREEMVYGNSLSFYDLLKDQMAELTLTPQQEMVMEYLIFSLDDDGLLRKSADLLADEMAIYRNIDCTTEEVEQVLDMLRTFDPAGIGASNLQQCLLLQIERKPQSATKEQMTTVVNSYFNEFTHNNWDRIAQAMQLTPIEAKALAQELRKLNPKPGAAMGETAGRNLQQITPDFIIDTQDDGSVSFSLNSAEVPELCVSQSFADMLQNYKDNPGGMSKQMKEALLYTRKKVEAAKGFIDAVRMRRHTLTLTMQAIVQWQRRFFEDGDESSLRPMLLRDIAEKTGLDISTVSRVSNSKYAQTRWGTFPLRFFFNERYVTKEGEELSTRTIKAVLREIIDAEDKRHPLSDEQLTLLLKKKGFPIARRTVAKYREQLALPTARMRKE